MSATPQNASLDRAPLWSCETPRSHKRENLTTIIHRDAVNGAGVVHRSNFQLLSTKLVRSGLAVVKSNVSAPVRGHKIADDSVNPWNFISLFILISAFISRGRNESLASEKTPRFLYPRGKETDSLACCTNSGASPLSASLVYCLIRLTCNFEPRRGLSG